MRVHLIVLALAATFLGTEARTQTIDCSHRTAEDFVPMSRTDRAADYVRSLSGPEAFLYAGTVAAIDQGVNRPREWGQGAVGYSRRFGNASAENIIGKTLQHGLALRLDEDNRYFTSGERGFARRLGYSLASPLVARHSNGSRSVSLSAIGGVAGAVLIAQIWQARSTSHVGNAGRAIGLTFAFRAGYNVAREFAPRAIASILR